MSANPVRVVEVTTKRFGDFTERWMCEPPPAGACFVVEDDEWDIDQAIRTIRRIRLAEHRISVPIFERAATLFAAADRLLDLCDESTSGTIQLAQAVREIAAEICADTNGAQPPQPPSVLRSSDNAAASGSGSVPGPGPSGGAAARPGDNPSASTAQSASFGTSPGAVAAAASPSPGPPGGPTAGGSDGDS